MKYFRRFFRLLLRFLFIIMHTRFVLIVKHSVIDPIVFRRLIHKSQRENVSLCFDCTKLGIGNLILFLPTAIAIKACLNTAVITVRTPYKDLISETVGLCWEDPRVPKKDNFYDAIVHIVYDSNTYPMKLRHISIRVPLYKDEAENYFLLARQVGYSKPMPEVVLKTKKVDLDFNPSKLKIAILTGGKNFGLRLPAKSKKWPYFYQLVQAISQRRKDAVFYFICNKEDATLVPEGPHIVNCIDKYSLAEVAYIIGQCNIAIGNDCGLMHIADVVKTKCYIIWGPTSQKKNSYFYDHVNILHKNMSCIPCQGTNRSMCEHVNCLFQLSVEDVLQNIIEI